MNQTINRKYIEITTPKIPLKMRLRRMLKLFHFPARLLVVTITILGYIAILIAGLYTTLPLALQGAYPFTFFIMGSIASIIGFLMAVNELTWWMASTKKSKLFCLTHAGSIVIL